MVSDPDLDISDERDFSNIVIQSKSGEKESVRLNETLSHSGVFTGSFKLKARENPTPANFSEIDKEIECFFGDKITVEYSDESVQEVDTSNDQIIELPVAIGTDGIVSAFSKIFGNH